MEVICVCTSRIRRKTKKLIGELNEDRNRADSPGDLCLD
jgi:hypothetical protein